MSQDPDYIGRDLKLDNLLTDFDLARNDITTVSGNMNLAQAILLRLRTTIGALPTAPEFGSRLSQLLGKGQSPENEYLARMMVGEALMREPRIRDVSDIRVQFTENQLEISMSVIGVNATDATTIDYVMRI